MPNNFKILLQIYSEWFGPSDIFLNLDKKYVRETMFPLEIVIIKRIWTNYLTSDDFSRNKR